MKKPAKKLFVVAVSAGIFASSFGTYTFKPMADEMVYSDANVSITSIVDRYIEVNGNVFTADEPEETEEAKTTATEEIVATGVIEEVTEDASVSGDIESVVAGVQDIPTEETTTETTLESETQQVADAPAACANFDFTGKAVVKASGSVNIRKAGDVNSEKVGSIPSGGVMTVVEQGDTWSHITSGNVDGYIKNEFVAFGSDAAAYAKSNLAEVAVINTAALKLRAEASTESENITLLAQGESYAIVSKGDAWTQIQVDNRTGYVKNEYIMISYNMPTARAEAAPAPTTEAAAPAPAQTTEATTEAPTTEAIITPPSSGAGIDVANFAVQFVGNPYVWGGTSLTNGADCSGFVQSVYKEFGYSLPRTCTPQSKAGTPVSISALAPGDLVFYDHGSGSCEHVAIYIGNGQVVHASSSRTGIKISNLNYSTPFKACRIIN